MFCCYPTACPKCFDVETRMIKTLLDFCASRTSNVIDELNASRFVSSSRHISLRKNQEEFLYTESFRVKQEERQCISRVDNQTITFRDVKFAKISFCKAHLFRSVGPRPLQTVSPVSSLCSVFVRFKSKEMLTAYVDCREKNGNGTVQNASVVKRIININSLYMWFFEFITNFGLSFSI